ncbi:hypothetical protein OH77DRAFT_787273 [Trametes cingulata]|nr:hypothetical protein OH77DRAFT_787273 [Trametes cingulata]
MEHAAWHGEEQRCCERASRVEERAGCGGRAVGRRARPARKRQGGSQIGFDSRPASPDGAAAGQDCRSDRRGDEDPRLLRVSTSITPRAHNTVHTPPLPSPARSADADDSHTTRTAAQLRLTCCHPRVRLLRFNSARPRTIRPSAHTHTSPPLPQSARSDTLGAFRWLLYQAFPQTNVAFQGTPLCFRKDGRSAACSRNPTWGLCASMARRTQRDC